MYTAEHWEYDARLGRRWNTDLLTYPWQSSYAVFNNNPILFNDPMGLEGEPVNGGTLKTVEVTADGGPSIQPIQATLDIPKPEISLILNAKPLDTEIKSRVSFSNKDYFKYSSNNFAYKTAGTKDDWFKRFAQFSNGAGPTNMFYGPEHSFTKDLKQGPQVQQARAAFYVKYYDDYTKGQFNNLASLTRYDGTFNPFDASTMSQQFVGTCKINIFTSEDAKRLVIVVANTTGKRSFYYHLPGIKDVPRTSAWGGAQESTLLNLYIWSEPINFDVWNSVIPAIKDSPNATGD